MSRQPCGEGQCCPYHERINVLYEKVITGNGDEPMVGRLKKVEEEMGQVLPILDALKTAADRQDGRDEQRLEDEKTRDRSWARFRQAIITITAIVGTIVAVITLIRH